MCIEKKEQVIQNHYLIETISIYTIILCKNNVQPLLPNRLFHLYTLQQRLIHILLREVANILKRMLFRFH